MTALHQLTDHISDGFNQKQPPHRTVSIALDMSKAFDIVNHHTLAAKFLNTKTFHHLSLNIFSITSEAAQHTLSYGIANHTPNS